MNSDYDDWSSCKVQPAIVVKCRKLELVCVKLPVSNITHRLILRDINRVSDFPLNSTLLAGCLPAVSSPAITGQTDTNAAGTGPAYYDADLQTVWGSEEASSYSSGVDQQSAGAVPRRTHDVSDDEHLRAMFTRLGLTGLMDVGCYYGLNLCKSP